MDLPQSLAFVDIETTGTRVATDRIIEIGIIRVENGDVVARYNSLFQPQTYVSPYIEQMTGITSHDLENAPLFAEKADEIYDLLADCVFVAHNVRFDFGFLRNEFSRLETLFSAPQLCTVKLSRRLYPSLPRHNLDSVIAHCGLTCTNRHRAMADADATWQFYQHALAHHDETVVAATIQDCLRRPSTPTLLSLESLNKLPNTPGVYIFYDTQDYPLYVGKSKTIRTRVLSHFASDYTSSREMTLAQQVARVEAIETPGELSALLRESQLVKELQPLYNRKLRQAKQLVAITRQETKDGYATAEIETYTALTADAINTVLGLFKTRRQAKDFLMATAKENQLCHKLLGLEKTTHTCFPYQLGWCKGACANKETPELYNLRFDLAFTKTRVKPWPFAGPIIIEEHNPDYTQTHHIIIDKWCIVGQSEFQDDFSTNTSDTLPFDWDTYTILRNYLLHTKNALSVKVLNNAVYTKNSAS